MPPQRKKSLSSQKSFKPGTTESRSSTGSDKKTGEERRKEESNEMVIDSTSSAGGSTMKSKLLETPKLNKDETRSNPKRPAAATSEGNSQGDSSTPSDNPELSVKRKRRRKNSLEAIAEDVPSAAENGQATKNETTNESEQQPAAERAKKSRRIAVQLPPPKEQPRKVRRCYEAPIPKEGSEPKTAIDSTTSASCKPIFPPSAGPISSQSSLCNAMSYNSQSNSQQSIHTPTSHFRVSQGSIDTPPVGLSRLPSQDGVIMGDPRKIGSIGMDGEAVAGGTNVEYNDDDDDMSKDVCVDIDIDTWRTPRVREASQDLPTPIPIPRRTMPDSFKLGGSTTSTPRLVQNQTSSQGSQGSHSQDRVGSHLGVGSHSKDGSGGGIDGHLPSEGGRGLGETQERAANKRIGTLFGDSPPDGVEDNEDEGKKNAEWNNLFKKRHTTDLGLMGRTNRSGKKPKAAATLLTGQTELVWNKGRKGGRAKQSEQEEITKQGECVGKVDEGMDVLGGGDEVKGLEEKPSPTISSITEDPIEEVTQTDDEIERVDAQSSRGAQLLLTAAAAQSTIPSVSSAVTGSLFASARVSHRSPASSDLASPSFDPAAFSADKMLHVPTNKANTSFRFSLLALTFDQIESLKGAGTGSRKKAAIALANVFRLLLWVEPSDLIPTIYFCLNKVAPDYEGLEVGVGESMLIKVMGEVYGRKPDGIKNDLKKHEDLGKVAELSRCSMKLLFKPPVLTIQSVFNGLKSLPTISGKNSQEQKKAIIKKLLSSAEKSEPKYIIRFLQAKMRVGVQSASIFQALAFAFVLTSPRSSPFGGAVTRSACSDIRRSSKKEMTHAELDSMLSQMEVAVRTALSEVSNVEFVTQKLFEGCTAATLASQCGVTPGHPVQPMLAKPTKGLQEVLTRFSDCEFTCEFKYDGERAQLHVLPDKSLMLFSRNLENLTQKYPDVINAVKDALKPDLNECILDCEVVAYDTETQKIQSFQVLSTRKRKGVEAASVTVQVCVMAFDCIQFNGQSLTKHPLEERRVCLHNCVNEVPNKVMFARHAEMATLDEVDLFFQEAVDANCEGLMVKTLRKNASYEPSKRSLNWLKIKKDYLEHLTDSVDLVPIGGYLGRGKRAKWYGTYLLACYNPDEEVYQTVCKVGTGFSEENLEEFYNFFETRITSVKDPSYQVEAKLVPDVWFDPCVVWEVRAADLSLSPLHTGGSGLKHAARGIGLRFPRFIRVRGDKKPEQATTHFQIVEMYDSQFSGSKAAPKTLIDDDDDEIDEDD